MALVDVSAGGPRTSGDPRGRATPPSAPRAPRRRRGGPQALLLFLVPALLFYGFVLVVPTVRGAYLSLTDWDGLSRDYGFVGLQNFIAVFTNAGALNALWVTLVIALAITVLQNGIGLLLALGVNSTIKTRHALRVLFFAPAVITPVVVAYLWKYMLTDDGAVNSLLGAVGLGELAPSWLGQPGFALASVIVVIVWQHSGYSMVIFLAGLQSVPDELREAAQIDGAGPVRTFASVIWPLLRPATTINVLLTIIAGLKVFSEVFVLTGGGPGRATETMSTLIYKSAFQYGEFAYSIALAIVLAVIVVLFTGVQYRLSTRKDG